MRKWLENLMGFDLIAAENIKLIEENKSLQLQVFQLKNEIVLLQAKRNGDAEPETKKYTNWQAFQQQMAALAEQRGQNGN